MIKLNTIIKEIMSPYGTAKNTDKKRGFIGVECGGTVYAYDEIVPNVMETDHSDFGNAVWGHRWRYFVEQPKNTVLWNGDDFPPENEIKYKVEDWLSRRGIENVKHIGPTDYYFYLSNGYLYENIIAKGNNSYFYRVHPKADIWNVIKDGLYSYSPDESPGSYVDHPEVERWPDQDENDQQTYRFYVASSMWNTGNDRFRIRIPESNLEKWHLEKDSLKDYYIDTGNRSEKILNSKQYDIQIGSKWIRADMVQPIMAKYWKHQHYKPAGFYGNKFDNDDDENDL